MRLFVALLCLSTAAQACLPAALEEILSIDERVAIIWNSETKVQHFIREPSFGTESKKMGFVVPIPSLPTLSEAKDDLVENLSATAMYAANQLSRWEHWTMWPSMDKSEGAAVMEGNDGLGIVSQFSVAGYEATIMKPTDAESVVEWLKRNGLPMPTGGQKWVDRYIQKRFHLVAFLFKNKTSDAGIQPRSVRITFKADRPFYPYAEPEAVGLMQSRSWMVTMASDLIMVPDMESPRLKFRGKTLDVGLRIHEGKRFLQDMGLKEDWSGAIYLTSSIDSSREPRPFDDLTWKPVSRWMVPNEGDPGEMFVLMAPKAERVYVQYLLRRNAIWVVVGIFAFFGVTIWMLNRRARKKNASLTQKTG